MNSRLLPLILLLLHIPGSLTLELQPVTCSQESICAVKGSQVTLKCSHFYINIKTVFWFSLKQSPNWRKNNEPEDLTLDSDYSGRVKPLISRYQSELIISDLRERDSGEYQLMFIMKDGVKRLGSVAVNLTVTGLQVRMNPATTDQRDQRVILTCDSSCTSGVWYYYYWMKDGQYFTSTRTRNIHVLLNRDPVSYSCALDQTHPSSSLCISEDRCWDVTYTSRRVCALMGSTVDISCTYSHPSGYTVNKAFWHYDQPGDFKDLREEPQFAGRVEYVGNTLRIKELKISDSGEYRFRIITDRTGGKYSGSPGVILTVTDTMVTSSPDIISEGQEVILSCSTKCTLSDKHTYIWYKNGRQVTDGFTKDSKLYLDSISNEELQEYSCAVGAREESTALRNTAVVLCVFLTLALIGVLWYRRRRCTLSKPHRVEKEEVLYDSVTNIPASSDLTQKADAYNQDINYSSVSFKTKYMSSISTALCETDATETEAVHYATVMFK
ncbi:sialoadhesin-like isoform X6 [Ctenopharyngodon idella]|uniref:sialoadhesin-like isoform X5 n=1 Tax=Ctenopharyngodon idella TaxID=7959 RepID=UPI00222FB5AD|nr:sialoadhesin-like isoform X5 [Ctenopharyngodon idella]XP_051765734.1 sialoadhesin-like isoform X5 [Ctenopharyngodon idella]XP_051765735.1 sialoadhesin-like isoform X6 [Ctenopharyngodon idella]XP_051765736.1 sialoadhesin-like isoform X5 [Ctenopharyngodon idella]XP_051765738.1 sialoadhesin-like isoform X5 [Ctenopharyngodon idella]XP_051765739.1 sialoadhesin-like isoform X6 [Ctenopharyngodon idella]